LVKETDTRHVELSLSTVQVSPSTLVIHFNYIMTDRQTDTRLTTFFQDNLAPESLNQSGF